MTMTAADYLRAIREHCRDWCSGGSLSQAKKCNLRECPLWAANGWHDELTKAEKKRDGLQMVIPLREKGGCA